MASGMTSSGFIPKRFAEIYDEMFSSIAAIVHPTTGATPFVNATDDSVLQQLIGVIAEQISNCWEAAYEASVQFDPRFAVEAGLSGLVQLNGLLRKPGAYTVITLTVTGEAYAVVPAGSRVSNVDGTQVFATLTDASLGAGGTASVQARCTVKGEISPSAHTIVLIQTPTVGWSGVTNASVVSLGSAEETDVELRVRRNRSISIAAMSIVESIYAAVMEVKGVTYCKVYQNATMATDVRNIPPKEVAVVVEGGTDALVAAALFSKLPIGVIGYGDTTITVTDAYNTPYDISFSRPTETLIYVALTVHAISGELTSDAVLAIKEALVAYAALEFSVGDTVFLSRLYTPINAIPNHYVISLEIGTAEHELSSDDIAIAWNEKSNLKIENITVVVS
jgi:uncharacterized phage protein gp47/JayE